MQFPTGSLLEYGNFLEATFCILMITFCLYICKIWSKKIDNFLLKNANQLRGDENLSVSYPNFILVCKDERNNSMEVSILSRIYFC